ncbi:MAG: hypothetical protein ACRD1Y_07655 [Terriglobales bacterium]
MNATPPLSRASVSSWTTLALLALASALAGGCGAALPALPVVSISPSTVSLQAGGGQQQFTATVSDAGNTAVVWKVNGHMGGDAVTGTITQSGMYEAPASVPTGGTVTVEAVSVANANVAASAVVTIDPGVVVTLSPASATLGPSAQQAFTANVTNATNTAVTWAVNGTQGGNATVGTITTGGLYTAPATFPGLNQVTITAASVADTGESAKAVVTLTQTVSVTVSPASVNVPVGQSFAFTPSVTGTTNENVTWTVDGNAGGNATVGTITAAGVYTAPVSVPSPAQVTVTATSVADTSKTANATVTVEPPTGITVSPATAQVPLGATQPFTANVTNATNTAVNWAVNGAAGGNSTYGTISNSGVYTAPATAPGTQTINVEATSVEDPAATATAVVTLITPIAVSISPTSATVNLGATQPFQATVTGGSGNNTAVNWTVNGVAGGNATLGTITSAGVFTAPSKMPTSPTETVTATSQANANEAASATLTLQVPPNAFTLLPASSTLTLAKAAQATVTLQLTMSSGFSNPVQFSVSGEPVNVTAAVSPTSMTASGAVQLTLTSAPISLAVSGVPIEVTATSKDSNGNPIVQTASVALTISGWAGQVSTLAGAPGGMGFEDGNGTSDELYPTAVTSDGGQNIIFADKSGHALREVNLVNQSVSTFIGGPYNYTIGEGEALVYDPANTTIYIADGLKNEILAYKVGSGDTDSILAGSTADTAGHADGVGTAATFDYPHGLVLSPDHATLYVADTSSGLIRKIDIASATVTTIAGQGGGTFCQPIGLALDAAGANLYVSDDGGGCSPEILQLVLATDSVSVVAGTSSQGQTDGPALSATFYAPSGLTMDPHAGTNLLYIADNNEVRALVLGKNPMVYTVAGSVGPGAADGAGTAATFDQPVSLTALADLNGTGTTSLFVADDVNGLIRRIDISDPLTADSDSTIADQVSTLAGQPPHRGGTDGTGSAASFNQPEGIVTDGTIAYVADAFNGGVREINIATGAVTTIAGLHQGYEDGGGSSAAFYQNAGIAWVPSQNVLYLTDTGNGAIRKLDLSTDTVSTVAGTNQSGFANGPVASARFNHPFGILASADGTKLYIADTGNNMVREIDLTTGQVSTVAGSGGLGHADGPALQATFSEPNGLAWDANQQNIYISDFETADIRELNLATGTVTTIVGMNHVCGHDDGPAASATLCDPAFLASDGRSLFWGDSGMGLLRVMDLATQQVYSLAGAPGVMHQVDGSLTETAGELTGPVQYNDPFGLALAPDGSFILITNKNENDVRIIR